MHKINETLFLSLHASEYPSAFLMMIAKFFADYALWIVPLVLIVGWMRGNERMRRILLEAAASGLAGLLINQVIALVWQHPVPFLIEFGHTFLAVAANSSFPSDHLTLLWAISFSLLMHSRPRMAGVALSLLGLPVAWARIELGVHFPLDIAGAALVACLSVWLVFREQRWVVEPVYRSVALIYERVLRGRRLVEAESFPPSSDY